MPFVFKRLAFFMSIAAGLAADKQTPFKAPAAAEFAHHQTNNKVTLGAEPYVAGDKVKDAFGKLVPYEHGVLPVLVAIRNDSGRTIKLDSMQVWYVGPHGDRTEATPAKDVRYSVPPHRPNTTPGPLGWPAKGKKNPFDEWEIEGRAFAAQALPSGNSAYGFFYFRTGIQRGATIYVSGMVDAASGEELLFFEVPLE
jgi:hypothetical protein